MAEIRL